MSNKIKIAILLFIIIITFLSFKFPLIAKAKQNDIFVEREDELDAGIPDVGVEEVSSWTERKGFEIIGLLQKFVQPFSIIIFIGCAILTLIGAFGNGQLVSRGIMGMVIALIMYAVVLYAPEIMDVFLNWVRN